VIYRQGLLKQGITESKGAMKEMMTSFVDNLDGMATSTGEYHDRITGYSLAIRNARSVADFNKLIDEVLQDTRRTQERARHARDDMLAARDAADAAETACASWSRSCSGSTA
jgi:methyl-accepting chemotaxis protein